MNYLMHYMLSGDDKDIIIGNYIADHIRGAKTINAQPNSIKKGIILHRVIDRYSDIHPAVKNSVSLLLPFLHHYAHVSVDIIYDHFLVKHWLEFSKKTLEQSIYDFHSLLKERFDSLPVKSQKITQKLLDNNWFSMYETLEGMQEIFNGMSKRASFKSNMEFTVNYLKQYYNEFDNDFLLFTHDMIRFIKLHKHYEN